jgi:acetyl esterase
MPIDPPLTRRERLEAGVARGFSRLSPRTQLRLAGGRPVRIDGQELDPGIQLVLAAAERTRGGASLTGPGGPGATPAEIRVALRRDTLAVSGRRTPVGAVRELEVGGAAGPLRARHYAPDEPGGPHPLLVFLHGGAFTIGDLDTHDEPCRLLCRHGGLHVLSVDYRLAPEHPFPAAVEDAHAALHWGFDYARELGADPARVAVGGDSAGGNLAAVATQLTATEGRSAALQVLIYPTTDFSRRWPSADLFGEGFFLTESDRSWAEVNYVGGTNADRADPRLSPLLADSFAGLPPAIVVTAAFDPLRDEGEAYAAALRAAGTPVVLRRIPGMIHGFTNMTAINRPARDATVEIGAMTRAALALAAAGGELTARS